MSWTDDIDRLAGLAGIEPSYFDIYGGHHDTPVTTKLLVLGALGFDVSSIPATRAAIAQAEEASWLRLIPAHQVRPAERPYADLFLPDDGALIWAWELILEAGGSMSGTFDADALPVFGERVIGGQRVRHRRLEFGQALPMGYHRLRIEGAERCEARLILVPDRCYLPPRLAPDTARLWGISTHLYTLRSATNWGIGDFSDLAQLCARAGSHGASAIACNPFHALFPNWPDAASPYSPSSRLFLNPLYIDVTRAPYAELCAEIGSLKRMLEPLCSSAGVDYPNVWALKREAFEALFATFETQADAGAKQDFANFVAKGGERLEAFAVFSTLAEQKSDRPWQQWPATWQSPEAAKTSGALQGHERRIAFHQYWQYVADQQLAAASASAHETNMGIGIVRDLALGIDPGGADVWMRPADFAPHLRCGAPPDYFQPAGQEWGILPLDPLRLRRDPEPFAALVRANMRHVGGLRIDHIIGLRRQFLVPMGASAADGCYVRAPLDDLLGILALESHRNQCFLIGEDLGTVPEGFRDRMHEKNIFGYSVLYFEREGDGAFKPPHAYREKAAASIGTHDLPTWLAIWNGIDIEKRRPLGEADSAQIAALLESRRSERHNLIEALVKAGLIGSAEAPPEGDALLDAVHSFLAMSNARLFLAQMDDLSREVEPINRPGTIEGNWRRKLSMPLEDPACEAALVRLASLCAARGRG
jgi:4-alpha-glucanotransferase